MSCERQQKNLGYSARRFWSKTAFYVEKSVDKKIHKPLPSPNCQWFGLRISYFWIFWAVFLQNRLAECPRIFCCRSQLIKRHKNHNLKKNKMQSYDLGISLNLKSFFRPIFFSGNGNILSSFQLWKRQKVISPQTDPRNPFFLDFLGKIWHFLKFHGLLNHSAGALEQALASANRIFRNFNIST